MDREKKKELLKKYKEGNVTKFRKTKGGGKEYYNLNDYKRKDKEPENESKAMNKKLIRLTEGDLHRIVKESVKRALNEINSITANSAFVKARDAYNKMVANGQENTPQAQKLLRQMNTFQSYNDWDSDTLSYNDENWEEKMNKQMNTPNQYGNTPSKYLTDYANAYGIKNFDPSRFMKTDRQYERNGDKYDYNNMSQADMNMHQQFNNVPAMQADMTPSRMKSPEQLGLSYGGGKKGFLGFGKKNNQWVANPNPNQ